MIPYEKFADNCARLQERVAKAAESCGRKASEIKILPVTKFHPLQAVEFACKYGFVAVGENRVQEAAEKIAAANSKDKTNSGENIKRKNGKSHKA